MSILSSHPSIYAVTLLSGQTGTRTTTTSRQVVMVYNGDDADRGGKRCERCERCSCKDFPTGVKFLVKNVIKGGLKNFSPKLYSKNVIKGGVKTPGNHKCL